MTGTMFDLWHFVEKAFSVWQNLLYSSGKTELQCGEQREFGVSRDLCWQLSPDLVPDGRLGAPSGVLSPCPPSTSTSWEQRAQDTLGTVPTGLVVTQVAPVPYQLQPPGQVEAVLGPQFQAQRHSPGLPQQLHGHCTACSGSELWDKTNDKFLWQLQFPKKLRGKGGVKKQENSD